MSGLLPQLPVFDLKSLSSGLFALSSGSRAGLAGLMSLGAGFGDADQLSFFLSGGVLERRRSG